MNFKYKCFLQKVFSTFPKGELLNYLFQKHITKSLPPSNDVFLSKVDTAFQHYDNYMTYNQIAKKTNKYYEFGSGWTLSIPLTMSLLNFKVFCIDIRKLIIPQLINDSLSKFQLNKDNLPFNIKKEILINNNNILENLKSNYNLSYIAPKDARNTGFEDNSFDFISSTATFEHIPKNEILLILKECYRILKQGG